MKKQVTVIGSDSGGTMTDMFVVDEGGDFIVGKASTTPKDESIGFWESLEDAFEHWQIDWGKEAKGILPRVLTATYTGTSMVNTLLTRRGERVGLICPKGHEDTLIHERAKQTLAGYALPDRLHVATHIHNEPYIPKRLIRGVTERISVFGEVVIPLRENEVREAVKELLDERVRSIIIWTFFSFQNPVHETRIAEIAREVMKEKGVEVPLYLSSEICPIVREVSRLNSCVLHAYCGEPGRKQLYAIENKLKENGYKYRLQIVLSHGGLASIEYPRLHEAVFSGPLGGILGGRFISSLRGFPNIVCTDMGGTSFDVGLIMGGEPILLREVELARMIFNIPTLVMDSIGAGMGMYLRIDPETRRLAMGPDSAGAEPGPVSYNMGNEIPTVMDCALILGIINPEYYLGGKLKLHKDLAFTAIKEKCSDVLGVDPYEFSEGVLDLINLRMREHVSTVLSVRGYSPADYVMLSYGGAGPMFMAGYSEGMGFKGVCTVPWAAAFSAFGCTVADFIHRYTKSTLIMIPPGADEATKVAMGAVLNMGWEGLEKVAIEEMTAEGIPKDQIVLEQIAYLRYTGQMEDLEVPSPVRSINTGSDMDKLITSFEDLYTRVYTYGARYSEVGYQILEFGLRAVAPRPKPKVTAHPIIGKEPPRGALKGERKVFRKGRWETARLFEMDRLQPGNEVEGLAIIEDTATTLVVPEDSKVRVDEFTFFWLEKK